MQGQQTYLRIDKVARIILLVVVGFLPLYFLPFSVVGTETTKAYFLALGILVVISLWAIGRLLQGTIQIPKHPIVFAGLAIPIVFLISAFFSPAWSVSFASVTLDSGTVTSISILIGVFFASMLYIKEVSHIKTLLTVLLVVFFGISLFQIAYLIFGPTYLNLGMFGTASANVVGKLTDFGLWNMFSIMLALVVLQFFNPSKIVKILLGAVIVVGLFFVALTNFIPAWIMLVFGTLALFVFALVQNRNTSPAERASFPIIPFLLLLISLLFVLANPIVGTFLPQKLGVVETEIRPSLNATGTIIYGTVKQDPILGAGPNRFQNMWLMYRPNDILVTRFWDTTFDSGFGFLPSLLATVGILGFLTVVFFVVLFLINGVVHAFRRIDERLDQRMLFSSFILALLGWISMAIYNPNIVTTTMTMVATGIFFSLLVSFGRIRVSESNFLQDPRKTFFAITFLVIVLLGSLSALFLGGRQFASLFFFAQANKSAQQDNLVLAESNMQKAIALTESDVYYRAFTTVQLSKLNTLLTTEGVSEDIVKSEFQNIFQSAEASARTAVAYDKTNTQNWIALASVYQNVVPLGITNAYENAKNAYEEARKLSPGNPGFDLLRARLELSNKNTDQAGVFLTDALTKKPNFIDAIFLQSQIDVQKGNLQEAIKKIENASILEPRSAPVYFQLGLLRYEATEYAGAVSAFEWSVVLDRQNVNALYYLGLAYEKVGRIDDAKKVFTILGQRFPNDVNVKKINENLEAGVPALTGLNQKAEDVTPATDTGNKTSEPAPKQ